MIHPGGGSFVSGARYNSGFRIITLMASSSSAEAMKPTIGEINNALPTAVACPQSTPEVPFWPRARALATPTP